MSWQSYSIEDALTDPKRVFGSPDNVVSDPRLDRPTKLNILNKWHEDARALARAEEEGMEGDAPPMLSRVQQAIDRLKSSLA